MKNIARIFAVLTCVVASGAGKCPRYPLIRDFNFETYLGMWYQQDKKQAGWELPGRCWKSLYLRDPKNGQYKMRMIFENTITGREEKYDSQLTLQGPEKPSSIKYTIPLTFLEDEFQVLATDYNSFSVEYKCDPNGILEKQESVFLLTREQNPSPLILQKAYAIMHRYGIDIRKLERVDQTCGGMRLAPNLPTPPHQEETDFQDYYSSPNQHIQESRYSVYPEDRLDHYEYYEEPEILTSPPPPPPPPKVLLKARRPAPKRRFWRPFSFLG